MTFNEWILDAQTKWWSLGDAFIFFASSDGIGHYMTITGLSLTIMVDDVMSSIVIDNVRPAST